MTNSAKLTPDEIKYFERVGEEAKSARQLLHQLCQSVDYGKFFKKSVALKDTQKLPNDLTKADPYNPGAVVVYKS